jgi:hypothetical protein
VTRRARRRQRGSGIPDWAWGVGLGALAVIIVGGFFLITEVISGGGGGRCDEELLPLGVSEISQVAFDQEVESLDRVIEFLNAGDRAAADGAFYGETHSFTHNVDPPLRRQDEELAKELCEVVFEVEDALFESAPTATTALLMTDLRNLIQDAAVALGYERPG